MEKKQVCKNCKKFKISKDGFVGKCSEFDDIFFKFTFETESCEYGEWD